MVGWVLYLLPVTGRGCVLLLLKIEGIFIMYQVYNERTGVIERRCKSVSVAISVAEVLTEVHAWIDGTTFGVMTSEV